MSTYVMAACWPLQMPQTAKAVLISLADNANDEGYCWPSIETIGIRTCLSERTVRTAIRWLEENNALAVRERKGTSSLYCLTPADFGGPMQELLPGISRAGARASHVKGGQELPPGRSRPPAGAAGEGGRSCRGGGQELPGRGAGAAPKPTKNRKRTYREEEPSAEPSADDPAVVTFTLNDKSEFTITVSVARQFRELYPGIDLMTQLRAIKAWCFANPAKRKTRSGAMTFVNKWLAKAQNEASSNGRPAGGSGQQRFDPVQYVNQGRSKADDTSDAQQSDCIDGHAVRLD